jgi:hypothetical protein
MIVKVTQSDFPKILESYDNFLWILHLPHAKPPLQIYPSWIENSILTELQNLYPNINIFESIVDEELDFLEELGISREEVWDPQNGEYRSFFITVKNNEVIEHSIGRCYCIDTVIEMLANIYPELFEPSSEG